MQVNNFGDLFLATTTPTDTGAEWFVGRIGNAAGDVLGTAVKNIPDATDEISVFPNPFTSSTNIRFTSSESAKLTLKLYDAQGRLLQEQMLQAVAGDNVVTMNTAVSKGAYLLKLEGGQTNLIKPVVIY